VLQKKPPKMMRITRWIGSNPRKTEYEYPHPLPVLATKVHSEVKA
jgi:hypothetical protein